MPPTEPALVGRAALADYYAKNRFNIPTLHAELVNRMAFGNKVIDQEIVTGLPTGRMDAAAIYEITPQGIAKVWFVSGA